MADLKPIKDVTPYKVDVEKRILTTLLFGRAGEAGKRVPLHPARAKEYVQAIKEGAWSPDHFKVLVAIRKAAYAGVALDTYLGNQNRVPQAAVPRAAIGRYTVELDLKSAIDSLNERAYIPKTKTAFEAVREAWLSAEDVGLENIHKCVSKLYQCLEDEVNGQSVVLVPALTKESTLALLEGDDRLRYPTGLANLDALLGGGLRATDTLMLSSGAKGAKTMMATTIATNLALAQCPVKYVSMEVDKDDLQYRILAKASGINYTDLYSGTYGKQTSQAEKLRVAQEIENLGIWSYLKIEDAASAIKNTRSIIESIESMDYGVVVIDHLGLVSDAGSKEANYLFRERLVAQIAAAAKKNKQVSLIVVAQLNADGQLGGSKAQNQAVTQHITWQLGDLERESNICCVTPKDWRRGQTYPIYFRLAWDRQSFFSLSESDPAVLEYLRAKQDGGKTKTQTKPLTVEDLL